MKFSVKDFPQNSFGKNAVTFLGQGIFTITQVYKIYDNFNVYTIQNYFISLNQLKKIVLNYGGYCPPTDNVLCLQGSLDPWRKLGYTRNTTKGVTAFYIEGKIVCLIQYTKEKKKNCKFH